MLYYRILLDTQRNGLYTGYLNDITSYVKKISIQVGAVGVYDSIAAPSFMEIVLNNASGDFTLQDTAALYYGKVRRGTLVKVEASLNGSTWVQLAALKIRDKTPLYQMQGDHELILKCTDLLQDFMNQDFVPPLQTNVRIDEILSKLHEQTAAAIWPYESYYQFIGHTSIGDGRAPFYGADLVDFETAETTLPFYGDNLERGQGIKAHQYLKDATQAEIFGLYWFSPRTEKFRFLSRYHATDTAISWYITTAITDAPNYTDGRDLVNEYALTFYPREIGTANSLLWESSSVPFQIGAQETKRITVKYRNPDFPTASVGALAVNDPILGTDIIANRASDGSSDDWTRFIKYTLIKGANSSELILYNRKVGDPAYITTLQIKGTPITAYNKETVYAYNDDSVFGLGDDETTGNDRASASDSFAGVSDIDFAQDYADYKVAVFGEPVYAIERLTIPHVQAMDTVNQTQIINRTIGDVINFVDAANDHDTDYMIIGEKHMINPATTPPTHSVTYTLRPTSRGNVFIIGESLSDEGDILSF